jgi:hypothetical protein
MGGLDLRNDPPETDRCFNSTPAHIRETEEDLCDYDEWNQNWHDRNLPLNYGEIVKYIN